LGESCAVVKATAFSARHAEREVIAASIGGLLPENDMKLRSFITLAALAAAPVFAAPLGTEEILAALRNVPPPELPARAAQVVKSAPLESRSAVATTVLNVVTQTRPASAGAVRSALTSSGALPVPKRVTDATPVTAIAPRANNGNGDGKGNGNGNGGGNVTPNTPNEHSRYPIAPPHGGNPPGHNGQPDRKGPPPFVDYSKPRGF
jgi:hypothetical protein